MRCTGFNLFEEFNHFVPRGLSSAPPHVLRFTPIRSVALTSSIHACLLGHLYNSQSESLVRSTLATVAPVSQILAAQEQNYSEEMKKRLGFWLKSDICWFEIKALKRAMCGDGDQKQLTVVILSCSLSLLVLHNQS